MSKTFRKCSRSLFSAICLLGTTLNFAATTVSGTVRSVSGRIMPHAMVEAVPQMDVKGGGLAGDFHNHWMEADKKGRFVLRLDPGRYRIHAKDEARGYPDSTFAINSDPAAKFPVISVNRHSIKGVVVRMGHQGGILDGNAQDSLTHAPLVGASIKIQDARHPDLYLEVFTNSSGHFLFPVAGKPLIISATSTSYKAAPPQDNAEIVLAPGEHRHVEFKLERLR